jgi:hypothetical protein
VRDPAALGPGDGEVTPPTIHKHSDYWLTAEYVIQRDAALTALEGPTPPSPPALLPPGNRPDWILPALTGFSGGLAASATLRC